MSATQASVSTTWRTACSLDDLVLGSGVVALVDGEQVAVFQAPDGTIYALENRDPRSGVNVMGRGLLGQCGQDLYVAAPLYKQRFRLTDGVCLDDPAQQLRTWPVRVQDGTVQIG